MGFYGEIDGRIVDIHPSTGQSSPPIEQVYTPTTGPGLASQHSFRRKKIKSSWGLNVQIWRMECKWKSNI